MSDFVKNAFLCEARRNGEVDFIDSENEAATEQNQDPPTLRDCMDMAEEDFFGSVRERIEDQNKELAWAIGHREDRDMETDINDDPMEEGAKIDVMADRNRHYNSDTQSEATDEEKKKLPAAPAAPLVPPPYVYTGKPGPRPRTRSGSASDRGLNAMYQKKYRVREKERREEMNKRVEQLETKVGDLEDQMESLVVENCVLKDLLAQRDQEVIQLKAQLSLMGGRIQAAPLE